MKKLKSKGYQLQMAREKFNKLLSRLQSTLREGRFLHLSPIRKERLIKTLTRYENQLRKWGIAVAAGSAMLLSGNCLLAQPIPKGSEFQVNTETINTKGYPQVALDDEGDFVVCWQSYGQDGEYWGIYAQRFDSSGVALGTEFRVNTYTANTQQNPSIASDEDGNFVIAWQSFAQEGFNIHIYAQQYDTSGAMKGGEFRVNNDTAASNKNPSVARTDIGYFLVLWEGAQDNIYAKRYTKNGVVQGEEIQVNVVQNGNLHNPAVVAHSFGEFTAVWDNATGDGSASGIRGQKYYTSTPYAYPSGGEFLANSYTTDAQTKPAIATDDFGQFEVVVWQSYGQDGDNTGIFGRRYYYYGDYSNLSSSEFPINTFTAGGQSNPAIAMDHNGNFVVTWQSYGQDGDGTGIYARRFHVDGTPYGEEFLVNSYTAGNQHNPSIAMDSDGDFVITWESQDDGNHDGIYAQRYALPCANPQHWYYDNDQDGYGRNVLYTFIACEQLPNTVADNTDCNDTLATIHPGAAELCNGIDENCDSRIDNNVSNCPAPVAFSTSGITPTAATLEWTSVPCANSYKVQLVRLSDHFSTSFNGDISGSISVSSLLPATQYKWMVKTKCASSFWSPASPWQYFSTGNMNLQQEASDEYPTMNSIWNYNTFTALPMPKELSENDFQEGSGIDGADMNIDLYPNPGDGRFTISIPGDTDGEADIKVLDGFGKLVHTVRWSVFEGITVNELDLTHLPGGVYHINIRKGDMMQTKKVVIVR